MAKTGLAVWPRFGPDVPLQARDERFAFAEPGPDCVWQIPGQRLTCLQPMASKNYDDLSKEELIRLLESRDRRDATRFGLV